MEYIDLHHNVRRGKYDCTLPFVPRSIDPAAFKARCAEDIEKQALFHDDAIAYLRQEGVPERYVAKVFSCAWESGHAYGMSEVASDLDELITIFK